MNKRSYEISPSARLDLLQIWRHLTSKASSEVADKVLADIKLAVSKVATSPQLGHRCIDLTERDILFYRIHSYLIIYRPDRKPLHILRIVHGARDVRSLLEQ